MLDTLIEVVLRLALYLGFVLVASLALCVVILGALWFASLLNKEERAARRADKERRRDLEQKTREEAQRRRDAVWAELEQGRWCVGLGVAEERARGSSVSLVDFYAPILRFRGPGEVQRARLAGRDGFIVADSPEGEVFLLHRKKPTAELEMLRIHADKIRERFESLFMFRCLIESRAAERFFGPFEARLAALAVQDEPMPPAELCALIDEARGRGAYIPRIAEGTLARAERVLRFLERETDALGYTLDIQRDALDFESQIGDVLDADDREEHFEGEAVDRWSLIGEAGDGHRYLFWDLSREPQLRLIEVDNSEESLVVGDYDGTHAVILRLVISPALASARDSLSLSLSGLLPEP